MQSEISTWLSSIPCGLDFKYLAKDFEDRDKKALINKIPVGEENDWKLPLIIEEFARRNIQPLQLAPAVAPSETLAHDMFRKLHQVEDSIFCCSNCGRTEVHTAEHCGSGRPNM